MELENKWDLSIPGQATLRWSSGNFENVSVIVWRNIIIKIAIEIQNRKYGGGMITKLDLYLQNDKQEYLRKFESEDHTEIQNISNGYYFLKFSMSGLSVRLSEKPVHEGLKDMASESEFNIISLDYEDVISLPKVPVAPDTLRIQLFYYKDDVAVSNNDAYFEKEDLVVDSWEMGLKQFYENEYLIIVRKQNLQLLFGELKVNPKDKPALLKTIANQYNGADCYQKFKAMLNQKNIPFEINTMQH